MAAAPSPSYRGVAAAPSPSYRGVAAAPSPSYCGVAAAPSPSQSTTETRATDYAADGTRFDVVVSATSDHDAVTNSLTRYDAIGRTAWVWSPLGVTSNIYLNASTRLVSSIFSADGEQPVRTDYLYDAAGERCGTVRNDVTNRTDVAYETIDGATWRVTTQSVSGPRTNAVVVTRERLTGLSDACRSHVIVRAADGAVTETRTAFDPATGIPVSVRRQGEHGHASGRRLPAEPHAEAGCRGGTEGAGRALRLQQFVLEEGSAPRPPRQRHLRRLKTFSGWTATVWLNRLRESEAKEPAPFQLLRRAASAE